MVKRSEVNQPPLFSIVLFKENNYHLLIVYYFIFPFSVTEAEVDKGLLSMQDKDHGCLWFHRIIYDLREHIDNPHVNKFMNPSDDLNKEAPFLLERLKSNMRERMHASNRKEYKIMWHENGK